MAVQDTPDGVDRLARALLDSGDGEHRYQARLAAVIRHAGWEARTLAQLSVDERLDVVEVLGRISAGSHYPHLRADGTFEIRRAVPAQRGWGTGKRKPAKTGRR